MTATRTLKSTCGGGYTNADSACLTGAGQHNEGESTEYSKSINGPWLNENKNRAGDDRILLRLTCDHLTWVTCAHMLAGHLCTRTVTVSRSRPLRGVLGCHGLVRFQGFWGCHGLVRFQEFWACPLLGVLGCRGLVRNCPQSK